MDAIFTRTSVRNYEEKPVEAEKIEKILRAAMAAPSAMNQRPWEFYVVTDKNALEALSKVSPYAGMTGLGGVMLGIAPFADRMEKVARVLDLPVELEAFTVVPFGYPAKKNPQQDRYEEARVHYVK